MVDSRTDEWDFVISGMLRVGIYAANGNSRTFNFVNDDVGYIKKNSGHYIECVSSEPCEYLEIFKTDTIMNSHSINSWQFRQSTLLLNTLELVMKLLIIFLKRSWLLYQITNKRNL